MDLSFLGHRAERIAGQVVPTEIMIVANFTGFFPMLLYYNRSRCQCITTAQTQAKNLSTSIHILTGNYEVTSVRLFPRGTLSVQKSDL